LAAAHVPPEVGFATKPRLAGRMVERAIAAGVPFAWVAGDGVYGVGEIELALRRAGKGYVLGVNATQPFNSWIGKPLVAGTAEEIAQGLDPAAWRRLSAGEGTTGPRLSDWAYFELADLDADEYRAGATGLWTRGLLIRRSPAAGSWAYFTTWCLAGTTIETRVAIEGRRWAIEDAFETAKNQLGLDHNGRRHCLRPVVARLASPRLAGDAGLRHAGGHPLPDQCAAPKNADQAGQTRRTSSTGRSRVQGTALNRRIAVRLAQRRIQPAHIIAWSLWRRAHQAAAQRSHMKRKVQL